jgi:hypothetical protein
MKKLPLLLLLLGPVLCGVACAQSFDLTGGRLPLASLDGPWRFHTGDNPAWAKPNFDDSGWALLRSDQDWSRQGYRDYGGMAWYRFQVTVPAGLDHVSLYLPHIMTCYEVYADGQIIGTYGKMRPPVYFYEGGGRFQVYPLPAGKHAEEKVEIALRVWHDPLIATYFGGGPQYGGGLIGDSQLVGRRKTLDTAALHWYWTSDQTLALLETLAGLGSLALFALRRKEREYLWFGLTMLLSSIGSWIFVCTASYVYNVSLEETAESIVGSGAVLASIAFYRALLQPGRTLLLKLAVASVLAQPLITVLAELPHALVSVWLDNLLSALFALPVLAWIVSVVVARAWKNSVDARLLAAPVILSSGASLVSSAGWITYTLGWQHNFGGQVVLLRNPLGITLSQATNGLFLLAVFAILILRFTRTRSQEERFASEVRAARNMQQYLIPEQLPETPGLNIESEYRPALEVGGDFFQVLPNAGDGSALIVVGDVAGHGMEAGMLATLIVGAIQTAAALTCDPERILSLLNERIHGRGLATCLAMRIEKDGTAALANAGHLPPYLNGQEMPMEGSLPLGAGLGTVFPVLRFRLGETDSLMLMTDGIAEAQDAQRRLFGFERIGEMVRKGVAAAALAAAAQDFGQEDDITVLTVARMAALEFT